jgi:hypothetical protein
MRFLVAGIVAPLLVAGCSRASVEEGLFFPTRSAEGAVPAGIVQGALVEANRCLYVEGNDRRTLGAWEDGMGFEDGTLLATSGSPTARVGEVIHGGGGYYDGVLGRSHVEELSGESIPERCIPEGPNGDRFAIIYRWLDSKIANCTTPPTTMTASMSARTYPATLFGQWTMGASSVSGNRERQGREFLAHTPVLGGSTNGGQLSLPVAPVAGAQGGETVVAFRSLDIFDSASATIGPLRGTPRELVMSRSGTLTSTPSRVSTMYVCASSSKYASRPTTVRAYPPRDATSNKRSRDRVSELLSHERSNGDAGRTGGLVGASMLTGSMRVVMLLPPKWSAPGPSLDGPTGYCRIRLRTSVWRIWTRKGRPTRGPMGTLA